MRIIISVVLAALAATSAHADGRLEINQAMVEAAGGFPYEIAASGNYVLTSDLIVAENDVNAITISALGGMITIDLNGFRIEGPFLSCVPGNCPQGSASGIGTEGFASASTMVSGGAVSHFSGDCIRVGRDSRVMNMRVSTCGRSGIVANIGSVVTGSAVSWTGENGIRLSETDGGVYAHNSVRVAGVGDADHTAITGGAATAGNQCDDGSCATVPKRRYYITSEYYAADEVLTACAAGFHAASLWEIYDTTTLHYDRTLGIATSADQGSGPPTDLGGWIRTGHHNFLDPPEIPGQMSCNAWRSTSGDDKGTVVWLGSWWDAEPVESSSPWIATLWQCDLHQSVWCVED